MKTIEINLTAGDSTLRVTVDRPESPQEAFDWQTHAEDIARAIEGAYHRGWADGLRRAYDQGPLWVREQVQGMTVDLAVPVAGRG